MRLGATAMSPEFSDHAKSQIHEAEAVDDVEACDCGECTECDERAWDHYNDQQTDAQIEYMHGIN